jgi:hypothetical protein
MIPRITITDGCADGDGDTDTPFPLAGEPTSRTGAWFAPSTNGTKTKTGNLWGMGYFLPETPHYVLRIGVI